MIDIDPLQAIDQKHLGATLDIKTLLILLHFLKQLEESATREQLAPLSSAFKHILSKEDLLEIIAHMYEGDQDEQYSNLRQKTPEELLAIIKDEYYILSYLRASLSKHHLLS